MNTPLRSVRVPDEVWIPAKARAEAEGIPLNTYRLTKLEQSLTFSDEKAVRELNWRSR